MSKPRIVIAVEGSGPTGGAERVAFDSARLLFEAGYEVVIFSSAASLDEGVVCSSSVCLDLGMMHDRFFRGGKKHMIRSLHRDVEAASKIEGALKPLDSSNTVLHVHGFHNRFTQAILDIGARSQMKTVVTCHDFGIACPNATVFDYENMCRCPYTPLSLGCLKSPCMGAEAKRLKLLRFARTWYSVRIQKVLKRLDRLVMVSPFQQKMMAPWLGRDSVVIPNPIVPASTSQQDPSLSNTYLWVGRLTAEKDPFTPLQACQELGLELLVVGDGLLREEVLRRFPSAHLLGWKSSEEVQHLQSQARALILSSLWTETASLVVLECMAAGVPSIIPKDTAATSWGENGVTRIDFTGGDVESLKEALTQMADDETVRRLGRGAYDAFHTADYSEAKHLSRLEELYGELVR